MLTKKKDFLTIFLPTSPTPFTGFVLLVPKEETIDLNITIEEALRFTVSGGVIAPQAQLVDTTGTDSDKPPKTEEQG